MRLAFVAHVQGTGPGQDILEVPALVLRPASPDAGDKHLPATRGPVAVLCR